MKKSLFPCAFHRVCVINIKRNSDRCSVIGFIAESYLDFLGPCIFGSLVYIWTSFSYACTVFQLLELNQNHAINVT